MDIYVITRLVEVENGVGIYDYTDDLFVHKAFSTPQLAEKWLRESFPDIGTIEVLNGGITFHVSNSEFNIVKCELCED